ncbi:MAG TPA: hypothetical protein VMT95_08780 [Candidatus Binatia bacterium]|nr:hypothetical protein [Candidatus Binatia bacterium]
MAYQFKISGSTATYQGRADLAGGEGPVRQFWIPRFGHRLVNPQAKHIVAGQFHFSRFDPGDVGYWDYPHGGLATHIILGPDHPVGVTVSIVPK